jgi:hypothetical protein
MNERIGKLRIEACKWARENVPVGEYENASDEKFAELIVLECADVVDSAPFGNDYYANRIKEHFGVE